MTNIISASVSRRRKLLSGSSVALGMVLALAMASSANARGLVADDGVPNTITGCAIAAGCTAQSDFVGTGFDNVYVYTDGAISIGSPFANPTATDLSTFGNSFIAAGVADYAAAGFDMTVGYKIPTFNTNELELYWIFHSQDPSGTLNGQDALFGIYLFNDGGGQYHAQIANGMADFTWFNFASGYDAYCDVACANAVGGGDTEAVYGVYLPSGALIGSSFSGTVSQTDVDGFENTVTPYDGHTVTVNSDYNYPNYALKFAVDDTSTSVPEPASLPILAVGLAALGGLVRRSRRRASSPK
jgi:MYXO-CTERM domain-containing protein